MALRILLGLVGLTFLAPFYPLVIFVRQEPALSIIRACLARRAADSR